VALTLMTQTIGLGFALILLVAVVLMMAYPVFLKRDFPEFEVMPGLLFLMGCWALAVGVALILAAYQQKIISILSSPWLILPAMVLGPILFLFRTRLPFAYGLAEVAASWTIISLAIAKPADSFDPNSGLPLLGKVASILAGLYITVRGLDNMDKQVPTLYKEAWRSLFHGRRPIN
jgi:hypothetical protein